MFADLEFDQVGSHSAFKINSKFADSYKRTKQREELADLNGKYAQSEDEESTDTEEDENGHLLNDKVDSQIMNLVGLIRNKDTSIYDAGCVFFADQESKPQEIIKTAKPFTLTDYHREQLLNPATDSVAPSTFANDQMEVKQKFLDAVDQNDDDDDLFTIKTHQPHSDSKMLDALNGDLIKIKSTDPNESFLLDFVVNKKWIFDDNIHHPLQINEDLASSDDSLANVEKNEDFEHSHNFRFEEQDSQKIITHSRSVPQTIRRIDSTRVDARNTVNARKALEKSKKTEDLKRIKKLKMEEVKAKIEYIRMLSGGNLDTSNIGADDFDGDFEERDYDLKMSGMFGDAYYDNRADASIKPVFSDEIDIDDLIPPNEVSVLEQGTTKRKNKKRKSEIAECEDPLFNMDCDHDPENMPVKEVSSRKKNKKDKKTKKGQAQAADCEVLDFNMDAEIAYDEAPDATGIVDPLEELYQLDYEDMIGDLPVRFKYKTVDSKKFGITPIEILTSNDADLNEFMPLKRLAPYRSNLKLKKDEDKWKVTKKKKVWELRKKLRGYLAAPGDEDLETENLRKSLVNNAGVSLERSAAYLTHKEQKKLKLDKIKKEIKIDGAIKKKSKKNSCVGN